MPLAAKLYVAAILASGSLLAVTTLMAWNPADVLRFCCYLLIGTITSVLKVGLPGIMGTMSVNFLFVLIGIVELSLPEALVIGCSGTLFQCLWRPKHRLHTYQILFSIANVAVAAHIGYGLFHWETFADWGVQLPLRLALAGAVYFVANTFPIAAAIALTEGKSLRQIWTSCYFWSFPYYLVGAAVAGLLTFANSIVGWQAALLILPVIFVMYRSYRLYLDRLESEKRHAEEQRRYAEAQRCHAEEMAALNLRTVEALALAIEAKDQTTHDHLQRVQAYVVEIARELGVDGDELEALRAASLLHDIGKLAVPEHIISKPGKLTPEEFEKMKIHPVVGAEILERVQFPYPVVPIVRSHHEKWDGSGYPDGLAGQKIPLGARILAAVDCFDALASDRQYRRALSLEDALAFVVKEAGRSFDPRVVDVLVRRYNEIEGRLPGTGSEKCRLSTNIVIENGDAPAAGFEQGEAHRGASGARERTDFLLSIAAARQEGQALFEVAQSLGNSLSLNDTLSVLAGRLKRMIPHDGLAVYVCRDGHLVPEYVGGDDSRLFTSLRIPMGQGLSGWVAENRRPIINGNPSVEPGYLGDPTRFSKLRSAIAVPLEGVTGVIGVLALYHTDKDAFSRDHLRILQAVSAKLGLVLENSLKYQEAEDSAITDYLTGLPNARSLFLHLEAGIHYSERAAAPLAVLVCDLNDFKQINDRYGHLEGNRILRSVAERMQRCCRESDYIARMGGDEFVVVLAGLHPDAVAERIRSFQSAVGRDGAACLSIGHATYPEDGLDAESLLAAADRRMYMAKQEQKQLKRALPALPQSRGVEPDFYLKDRELQFGLSATMETAKPVTIM
jgi:diguanylate cyclase (GGDEF)-like protein/putative nucleotidyltransferase with HDIG domain